MFAVVSGTGMKIASGDEQSNSTSNTPNARDDKIVSPVERFREIAPAAIRFRGRFVIPTTDSTSYFQSTENGEEPVRWLRSMRDQK